MKKIFAIVFTLNFLYLQAQKYTISGYVKDAETGESLIGCNVYVKDPIRGTTTNTYGFYSLTLEKGSYRIYCTFLGYQNIDTLIELNKNITLNFKLNPVSITKKEVIITGERPDKNVQSAEMGSFNLPIETIKSLPAIFGEIDILKTLQLKPGIQSGGEGTTGFYVRGGGPDQNLILLDEAVVYNANHLFGFFSVFNSDAIQNVEVFKGSMPANYGGRLASVLDISMKEGNNNKFHSTGGIGTVSSRLTVEGPIKKDTASFIISGRRTYIDILMKPFIRKTSPYRNSSYYFYDLNAKFNYRLSDKDRIFLSGYFGEDIFDLSNTNASFTNQIAWGNSTAVFRWNHLFSSKLFSNISVIYSQYKFKFDARQSQYDIKLRSGIEDFNTKVDLTYIHSPSQTIKFGVNHTYHIFTPNNVTAKTGDVSLDLGPPVKLYSTEGAIYINDEFDLTPLIKLNVGARYSTFSHLGPFNRFIKDPLTKETIDTIKYSKNQIVKTYNHIEPRFSSRFLINEKSSIKASYTQNYQYIHLASMSSVSLPTDIWVPSTDVVKPQFGTQYSVGYFRNFYKNMFEASVEVFYKEMKNQIEFKEGSMAEDNLNNNTDNNFTFGQGKAYGIELFLNKQFGNLTGWIGYTLSKSERKFPEINNGEPFPPKYDRRHDVSIILIYEFNKKWQASLVWVYQTGNTATMPVSRYIIEGNIINEYGKRNSYRLPPYHRMDFSINYYPQTKKQRKWQSNWNFSVYNLYNRKNPYYIYFENTGNIMDGTLETKAIQVSLFPILPAITYNFKF